MNTRVQMEKKRNLKTESNPLVDKKIQTIDIKSSDKTKPLTDNQIRTISKLSEEKKKTENGKTIERLQKKDQ